MIFEQAMKNIEERFSQSMLYPNNETTISRDEFNAIKDKLKQLEKLQLAKDQEISELSTKLLQISGDDDNNNTN